MDLRAIFFSSIRMICSSWNIVIWCETIWKSTLAVLWSCILLDSHISRFNIMRNTFQLIFGVGYFSWNFSILQTVIASNTPVCGWKLLLISNMRICDLSLWKILEINSHIHCTHYTHTLHHWISSTLSCLLDDI